MSKDSLLKEFGEFIRFDVKFMLRTRQHISWYELAGWTDSAADREFPKQRRKVCLCYNSVTRVHQSIQRRDKPKQTRKVN